MIHGCAVLSNKRKREGEKEQFETSVESICNKLWPFLIRIAYPDDADNLTRNYKGEQRLKRSVVGDYVLNF